VLVRADPALIQQVAIKRFANFMDRPVISGVMLPPKAAPTQKRRAAALVQPFVGYFARCPAADVPQQQVLETLRVLAGMWMGLQCKLRFS
jgi:hypothetical protein